LIVNVNAADIGLALAQILRNSGKMKDGYDYKLIEFNPDDPDKIYVVEITKVEK